MSVKTRALCLFCALLFLLLPLCSCTAKGVLSYGTERIDERLFRYALTLNKTKMLSTLSGTTQNLTDDPSLWTADLGDGSTYADLVLENTLDTMKMTLFYTAYAKENSLSLSAEEKKSAEENVEKIVSSFSSREEFDKYMKGYGFDYDLLLDYYLLDALSQLGMRAYYNHPETSLTQADVKAYYKEQYATFLYLYVNETDMTLSNGKTVLLNDEQKAEKAAFFEAAKAAVSAGDSFDEYLERSDDGLFVEKEEKTLLLSGVSPKALSDFIAGMEEDSLGVFEGEKGRYLVKKYPLSEDFFETYSNTLLLSLIAERESALLESLGDGAFLQNASYFETLDIANLAIF